MTNNKPINRQVRPPKDTDHDQVQKAICLIKDLVNLNLNVEKTLWISAFVAILCDSYGQSGFTYEEFRKDMESAFDFYKDAFKG